MVGSARNVASRPSTSRWNVVRRSRARTSAACTAPFELRDPICFGEVLEAIWALEAKGHGIGHRALGPKKTSGRVTVIVSPERCMCNEEAPGQVRDLVDEDASDSIGEKVDELVEPNRWRRERCTAFGSRWPEVLLRPRNVVHRLRHHLVEVSEKRRKLPWLSRMTGDDGRSWRRSHAGRRRSARPTRRGNQGGTLDSGLGANSGSVSVHRRVMRWSSRPRPGGLPSRQCSRESDPSTRLEARGGPLRRVRVISGG